LATRAPDPTPDPSQTSHEITVEKLVGSDKLTFFQGAPPVSELDLGKQVSNIRAVLQTVEAQVARGRLPQEGLADFKSAVDDVRLRLWGIMSAASSGEYDSFVERFRLRRATEILRELAQDVQGGKVPKGHPEMEWLIEAARNLIAAAR
jgi:hypothetical protein